MQWDQSLLYRKTQSVHSRRLTPVRPVLPSRRNQINWVDVAVAFSQISEQVVLSASMSSGKKFNFLFTYLLTVRI